MRDKSFRERFERETEIAANVGHPHVVTLYDSGEGPGGQLFIAMRCGGHDHRTAHLTALATSSRARRSADLADRLALDAAHSQSLVHRDVKSANILVAGDEGTCHAYLTDFGLAKRLSSESALTGVGLMVGTVDYGAGAGDARPVDLRADVYALGATLFMALTGEVPYPAKARLPVS